MRRCPPAHSQMFKVPGSWSIACSLSQRKPSARAMPRSAAPCFRRQDLSPTRASRVSSTLLGAVRWLRSSRAVLRCAVSCRHAFACECLSGSPCLRMPGTGCRLLGRLGTGQRELSRRRRVTVQLPSYCTASLLLKPRNRYTRRDDASRYSCRIAALVLLSVITCVLCID